MSKRVMVLGEHYKDQARNLRWVSPVDWEPKRPAEFQGEEFTLYDGSIWGEEEEEAGIVLRGSIEEGEEKEVDLADLEWIHSNCATVEPLDSPVEVA
jgi:hypothetical protein